MLKQKRKSGIKIGSQVTGTHIEQHEMIMKTHSGEK